MAEDFELTEAMRAVIGVESSPWTYEVTSTGARMFARAVGYTDPVYFDEEAARGAGHAAIPAAPGYLGTPVYDPRVCDPTYGIPRFNDDPVLDLGLPNVLDGGTRTVYERQLLVGDVLSSTERVAEISVRTSSKLGRMVVVSRERTFTDEGGSLAVRQYTDGIYY